jgi:hypothetical protein
MTALLPRTKNLLCCKKTYIFYISVARKSPLFRTELLDKRRMFRRKVLHFSKAAGFIF